MAKSLDIAGDVLITIRDGHITSVYGPEDIRVVVIDFDELQAGAVMDLDNPTDWNEAPVSHPGAMQAVADAREMVEMNEQDKRRGGKRDRNKEP